MIKKRFYILIIGLLILMTALLGMSYANKNIEKEIPPTEMTKESKEKPVTETKIVEKELEGVYVGIFTVTAYDLSVQSCGKPIGSPGYGITASGFNLTGHTRESAMTVAVDNKMFRFGTKLKLEFTDPKFQKYNGIYTARDTGGAIKGNRLDLFFGDFNSNYADNSAMRFGRREAKVIRLN